MPTETPTRIEPQVIPIPDETAKPRRLNPGELCPDQADKGSKRTRRNI